MTYFSSNRYAVKVMTMLKPSPIWFPQITKIQGLKCFSHTFACLKKFATVDLPTNKTFKRRKWLQWHSWQFQLSNSDSYLQFHLKVGLSPSKKKFYLVQWYPFKNDEKYFLYYLKSSFRSQDIYTFDLTFWACRKNGLIRKISLILKFMTSQPGLQRITRHILLNISQIKGNQTMKFGQLIEHPMRNIFF